MLSEKGLSDESFDPLGVDDERNIVGLHEREVDRAKDQLTQMMGSWLEPRPASTFDVLPIADSDRVALELWVEPGPDVYGCGRPGEVRTVYVRHHGVTERASLAEITAPRSDPEARHRLVPRSAALKHHVRTRHPTEPASLYDSARIPSTSRMRTTCPAVPLGFRPWSDSGGRHGGRS